MGPPIRHCSVPHYAMRVTCLFILTLLGCVSSLQFGFRTKSSSKGHQQLAVTLQQDLQSGQELMIEEEDSHGNKVTNSHSKSMPTSVWLRKIGVCVAAALGAGVLVDIITLKENYAHHSVPGIVPVAHADSTGKMSTKLTARKRYLPRIADGVNKFNALASDESVASAFLRGDKPGYEGFVRAMNLFGASLRVGETPDKISREAEEIVADFNKEIIKVAKLKTPVKKEDLATAASKLKQYIDFAEQHVASPIDHYQVNF